MAILVITAGAGKGKEFTLKERVVIGRRPENVVSIDDHKASRDHAEIFHDADDYILLDLSSHNGTKVNGSPIQRHTLADGDEIAIGSHRLRFYESAESRQSKSRLIKLHAAARSNPPPVARRQTESSSVAMIFVIIVAGVAFLAARLLTVQLLQKLNF